MERINCHYTVDVLRNGIQQKIRVMDLLIGDIVLLR